MQHWWGEWWQSILMFFFSILLCSPKWEITHKGERNHEMLEIREFAAHQCWLYAFPPVGLGRFPFPKGCEELVCTEDALCSTASLDPFPILHRPRQPKTSLTKKRGWGSSCLEKKRVSKISAVSPLPFYQSSSPVSSALVFYLHLISSSRLSEHGEGYIRLEESRKSFPLTWYNFPHALRGGRGEVTICPLAFSV